MKMMKLVTVANPIHQSEFFKEVNYILFQDLIENDLEFNIVVLSKICVLVFQVEKHYCANEVPEMTLEKLQMVATCNTSWQHKVKFLQW